MYRNLDGWLSRNVRRTPPLAGKLQSPLCAGWQYVSFRILNYAGWLISVVLLLAGSEEQVIFSQESIKASDSSHCSDQLH